MPRPTRKHILIYILVSLPVILLGIWFFFLREKPQFVAELPKKGPAFLNARNEHWADSVLATLSQKEKIAQLVMLETDGLMENVSDIETAFSDHHYGGIFYRGTNLVSHITIFNHLQKRQEVAPFFAVKAPFGLYELSDSSYAPPVYATFNNFQDDSVLTAMARYVAGQCRALNIHINFSQNFDVIEQNEDPAFDPGYKQFSDDLVRKSLIYSNALADSGILSVQGSFMNLGTSVSLQKEVPVFTRYEKRWDTLRIKPYKMLVDSGLQGMWVNYFPQWMEVEQRNDFLLQKPQIKDSLIRHTGFQGLVFGDLRQPELRQIYTVKEAAFLSVMTGADMIVVNDSAGQIVDFLYSRLGKKGFTEDVLNKKVKKILMAKSWAGVPRQTEIDWVTLARSFDKKRDYVYSEKLYESGMVLLQDNQKMIPLNKLEKRNVAILSVSRRKHYGLIESVNHYFPVPGHLLEQGKDPKFYDRLSKELSAYNTLIIGVDVGYYNPGDTFFVHYLDRLREKRDVAVILFGDHRSIGNFADYPTILLAYGHSRMAEYVAGQMVMGGFESSGKLPVSCSGRFCYADGLPRKKVRVRFTVPEFCGVSSDSLNKIDYLAENSIKGQATPGMQVLVIKDGNVIFQRSYGYFTYTHETPVANSSVYDLASVTKVAATTIGCMMLYDQGKLKLDTTLSAYLPDLEKSELKNVKIRDVLLHRAGFPAVPPIFKYIRAVQKFKKYKGRTGPVTDAHLPIDSLMEDPSPNETDTLYRYAFAPEKNDDYALPVGENIYLRKDMLDSIYLLVTKTRLISPVEYKYSDMSMYIMMQVIKSITGKPLDEFMMKNVYQPMGLHTMGFNPLDRFSKEEIVPTEQDDIYRKQLIHGYVHDPTASVLGGVSGHAGLFSDAIDLGTLMQMVLNGGSYGGRSYFSSETVNLFTAVQSGSYRGLGWDHQYASGNPMCADSASVLTYGHTGFTGTCVWVDPKYKLIYVFLSNRVYPTAENKKLQTTAIRQRIHQAVYNAILN